MASNELKQRIANKLQGNYDIYNDGRYTWLDGTLFNLEICATTETRLRNGLRYLADLMEPDEKTCKIIWSSGKDGVCDGVYTCSSCGVLPQNIQELWDDYQAGKTKLEFNYCPRCGAKVVKQ